MKIGITGASGFIASHLAKQLIQLGHEIVLLVRKTSSTKNIADLTYKRVEGDITNYESLEFFVRDCEIIIHAAAITSAPVRSDIFNCNYLGTLNLVRSCRQYNPQLKRFIFISTQEAAGINPDGAKPLDEEMPLNPITPYGISKKMAENAVKTSGIPFTIVKPGAVYGPGDKDGIMFFQLASKKIFIDALFKNVYTMSYIENLVAGITGLMNHPNTINNSYYITDSDNVYFGRIFRILRSFYGNPIVKMGIPRPLLFVVAALNTAISTLTGKRQIFNLDKYRIITSSNCSVSNQKAQRDFGYKPPYSSKEALLKTALHYHEAKLIRGKK